jgi:hypothetical protein
VEKIWVKPKSLNLQIPVLKKDVIIQNDLAHRTTLEIVRDTLRIIKRAIIKMIKELLFGAFREAKF